MPIEIVESRRLHREIAAQLSGPIGLIDKGEIAAQLGASRPSLGAEHREAAPPGVRSRH